MTPSLIQLIQTIQRIKQSSFERKVQIRQISDLENRKKSDVKESGLDQALPKAKEAVFIQNYLKKIS